MKLVTYMGEVYRMSDRSYTRMLRAIAAGKESPTFAELKAKSLGVLACNTTDMDAETAQYYLERHKS